MYTPGDLVKLDDNIMTNLWVDESLTSAWLGCLCRDELVVVIEASNEFTEMTWVLSRHGIGYVATRRIMKAVL